MGALRMRHDRLAELEWLICHETDRDIRFQNIREFNNLYEEIHGTGRLNGSRESDLCAVRADR